MGGEWVFCPWDSPGKNTGVGCHHLQGIFLIQALKPRFLRLLHWQADSLLLSHLGRPMRVEASQVGFVPFWEETPESSLSFSAT